MNTSNPPPITSATLSESKLITLTVFTIAIGISGIFFTGHPKAAAIGIGGITISLFINILLSRTSLTFRIRNRITLGLTVLSSITALLASIVPPKTAIMFSGFFAVIATIQTYIKLKL